MSLNSQLSIMVLHLSLDVLQCFKIVYSWCFTSVWKCIALQLMGQTNRFMKSSAGRCNNFNTNFEIVSNSGVIYITSCNIPGG